MIEKEALKCLIVMTAIALFSIVDNGMGQTGEDEFNRLAFDDVVNMVTDALQDDGVDVVLCKVPVARPYSELFPRNEDNFRKFLRISTDMMAIQIKLIDILRGIDDIDSIFFLSSTVPNRDGKGKYLPSVSLAENSEWILFLSRPFHKAHPYHVSLMERYNKLGLQGLLNSKNFFTLYELDSGGLCTYYPKDAKYPPQFTYSESLVDDFKTIIELQENRSLLSESSGSYKHYYDSMKEELSRRVFSQLFENPNKD